MSIIFFSFMFIFVMIFLSSNSQSEPLKIKKIDYYGSLEGKKMDVYYNKSKIPRVLKKTLGAIFGKKFRIANPNLQYRKTDVASLDLPSRQMKFLAVVDNYYLLVFKQGGKAHSTYFVFSEVVNNVVCQINIFYISNNVESVQDLIQAIESDKIYPTNW